MSGSNEPFRTASTFGASSFGNTSTPFGQSTNTFGAKPATGNVFDSSSFGVSTPSAPILGGLFGSSTPAAGSGLFGQQNTGFGAPASTSTGGFEEVAGIKKKDEEDAFPKGASECQNGEINEKLSIDVQHASSNSELSQNLKLSEKNVPLQKVEPLLSSTRSPKKGLSFDKNSHTQHKHQRVSEQPHPSYDDMLRRLKKLRARHKQIEKYYGDFPDFPEIKPIYGFQRNQSTRRRPINVVRSLNESQNPLPSNSSFQSNTQVGAESNNLTARRLRNGSLEVKYHFTKPAILKVSKDTKELICIFPPPSNSRSPPVTLNFEVPNTYSNSNVIPEPVNPTSNENCHQEPTFTPFKKNCNELNACCPIKKQSTSFKNESLTVPKSNHTGTNYFVPYNREVLRFHRARSFRDASTNTESDALVYENKKSGNVVMEYSDNNTLEKKNS